MSKDYLIKAIKKQDEWESSYGKMQSYALVLEGVGEPVKLNKKVPVEKEPQIGDSLFGIVEEKKNRTGGIYLQFKTERRLEAPQNGSQGQSNEYWLEKDKQIRAQWAIGQSLSKFEENCYQASDENRATLLANIEDFAKELFSMVDRVKTGETIKPEKDPFEDNMSGKHLDPEDDPETLKRMESEITQDEPINLDDIPF